MLARHFIDRFCRDLNKTPFLLSPSAVEALQSYSWRGNVRELQNCIERAVILTEGDTIHARHLNLSFQDDRRAPAPENGGPWSQIDLSGSMAAASQRVLAEIERRKIIQALKEASGNAGRAAEILEVSFKTLQGKLKEYQIA
jgi:DNA-binding NtrC family response regulator